MDFSLSHDFSQRNFELIDLVVAGFVHARCLAGGANEHAAEKVAQRGVVVPVKDQAGQQFGATQERAVGRRGAAQHKVVAAPCAGVAAIGHEFFSAQAGFKGGLVQKLGVVDQLAPVVRGMDIDFDHARVGGDLQHLEARIAWRRVALQHELHVQLLGGGFHRREQAQVILQAGQRRHEHVQHAAGRTLCLRLRAVGASRVSHLDAKGRAHDIVR